jgi:hypothetical protein
VKDVSLPPLDRLAHPSAASDVASDPAVVLGLVEDRRQRAERLVDRVVSKRAEWLASAWIKQRLACIGSCADCCVLVVDASAVGLDRLHGDLRREQLTEEREEVPREGPEVVLDRGRTDLRVRCRSSNQSVASSRNVSSSVASA